MRFYQASLVRIEEKYIVVHTSEIGNPLITRVDAFRDCKVLRMMIAPQDMMINQWSAVNPLQLALRCRHHYKRAQS
jgi:hypothetical protein